MSPQAAKVSGRCANAVVSDQWIACAERMPAIGEQVVLANVNRLKSFDPLGCLKDVGVLNSMGGEKYWSTHGESRAQTVEAFTHWMAIEEPVYE